MADTQNYMIYGDKHSNGCRYNRVVALNTDNVIVGVNTGNTKIEKNELSGLNEEVDEIIGKTIYERKKVPRKTWFCIDLETGQRGWYPGSIRVGTIIGDSETTEITMYSDKSDTSPIVTTINVGEQVKIKDVQKDDFNTTWYYINYNGNIGYVRYYYIPTIRYVDPY